ncbi:hypothetical protein R50073_19280 [Maricurvus nonylphenolicus]|uniref:hypothetical protein n=1 Tax=Maricurvus nonylphenolicus TaxID=1008307 RepID=UPI0036F2251A
MSAVEEMNPAVVAPDLPPSMLGFKLPEKRAYEVAGMTSVKVQELFSDIPEPIYNWGQPLEGVTQATHDALAGVDLSRIKPNDTVNVLCSEHGFAMMGGQAYAEVLRSVHAIIVERTGCKKIRLGFACGLTKVEALEIAPQHGLEKVYEKIFPIGPYDKGVAIETPIGTLYGIGSVYKAKHIIHVHYDDPREVHFHRANGRGLKSFAMSYARFETRGVFHNNFPTGSAMLVPRMIYESEFVQSKFVAGVMLTTSPAGVTGVDADNDMIALDKRVAAQQILHYGKLIRLFGKIEDCVAVLDLHRWAMYGHAGGVTSCNLFFGPDDHYDLDHLEDASNNTDALVSNPALKAVVVNYMWKMAYAVQGVPAISTQPSVTRLFKARGVQKPFYEAENLEKGIELGCEVGGTDKVIIFDGTYGAINCSPSMAEFLRAQAPLVEKEVDEVLLEKWLSQRGLPMPKQAGEMPS